MQKLKNPPLPLRYHLSGLIPGIGSNLKTTKGCQARYFKDRQLQQQLEQDVIGFTSNLRLRSSFESKVLLMGKPGLRTHTSHIRFCGIYRFNKTTVGKVGWTQLHTTYLVVIIRCDLLVTLCLDKKAGLCFYNKSVFFREEGLLLKSIVFIYMSLQQ